MRFEVEVARDDTGLFRATAIAYPEVTVTGRTEKEAPGREEVGLRLEGRRGGPGGQVQHGGRRADGVGEGHQGSAVETATHRSQLIPDRELGDDPLLRGLDEPDAQQGRQRPLERRRD